MDFTCLKNFYSEETKSEYVKGMNYTARLDNEKLLQLLPKWRDEGKIEFGRPAAAEISGRGQVPSP